MIINPFSGNNQTIQKVADDFLRKIKASGLQKQKNEKVSEYLKRIIKKLGGKVEIATTPTLIEEGGNSIVIEKNGSFTIYLSPMTSPLRDNFTMAHELGHYIIHYFFSPELKGKKVVFGRYGSDVLERQANHFAANFLMPEEKFKKVCEKDHNISEFIASYFEVSISAVKARMTYFNDDLKCYMREEKNE